MTLMRALLLIPFLAFAESEDTLTNINVFPSLQVHCVNVISGKYCDTERDYRVVCPVPLTYERAKDEERFSGGWAFNTGGSVSLIKEKLGDFHKYHIEYSRDFGEKIYFGKKTHRHDVKNQEVDEDQIEQAFMNCCGNEISSHNHLRNIKLHFNYKNDPNTILVEEGDGTLKTFKKGHKDNYNLYRENLPDGNFREYNKAFNKQGELIGWFESKYEGENQIVRGSDGRQVIYQRKNFPCWDKLNDKSFEGITYISRPDGPPIHYSYHADIDKCGLIKSKDLPNCRYINLEYYVKDTYNFENKKHKIKKDDDPIFRRIRKVFTPLGTDISRHTMFKFWYNCDKEDENGILNGSTEVVDALGRKRIFHYENRRLTKIEYFSDGNILEFSDVIEWGHPKSTENANLKKRTIKNSSGTSWIKRSIDYDVKHNPIRDTVYGNWRGFGCSNDEGHQTNKKYSGDKFNLVISEEDEIKRVDYTYYPNCNKIASKIIRGFDGTLIRQLFEYDKNGVLSKETIDDGENYTERHVKKITSNMQGLPIEVADYYIEDGQEILKKKEINYYSPIGNLIKHEIYDNQNVLASSEEWDYDSMGNVVFEKNSMGAITQKEYDFNGNLIKKEGPLPSQIELYTYDFMNRLIKFEERLGDQILVTQYGYDLCGNRIYQIDPLGFKTEYYYNYRNQKIKTVHPDGTAICNEYDLFGNCCKEIDGEGNVTKRSFTITGKSYHDIFPDGSEEKSNYDFKGNLVKRIHKNGLVTNYERDSLGRILTTKNESNQILTITSATYNAFHCLSETDAAGITTYYTYNKQGQKVKEQKGNKVVEFAYDTLGRHTHTYADDVVTINHYDALGQIIEEKIENREGITLSHKKKFYDECGHIIVNSILTDEGWVNEEFSYNQKGQLIEASDALGYKTLHLYQYTPKGLRHTTIDPKGVKLITDLDYAGRITNYEKQNPIGETLQKREFSYDRNNNKTKAVETVYQGTKVLKTITTLWTYDKLNRCLSLTEGAGSPEQKRTSYVYNRYGQKSSVIKPDGTSIDYQYDLLGRQIKILSSDQTINMDFVYDTLNHVIEAKDNNCIVKRTYQCNDLLSETINDIELNYSYDSFGRLLTLQYPDRSETRYTHKNGKIETIDRKGLVTKYNYSLNGKVSEINHYDDSRTLIDYDFRGRETRLETPYAVEELVYDEVGNVIKRNTDTFTYDSLNQILSENEDQYAYDSRYNCYDLKGSTCTYNSLDQLTYYNNHAFTYDQNGNLIQDNDNHYRYDALDRLIEADTPNGIFTYTYDPFNRRIAKNNIQYLYQGENEIGSISPEHTELRILGVGKGAENSAAILFELNGETYLPHHDHRGNLTSLIKEGEIVETHHYNAFGETNTNSLSPWLFSSKRHDEETGLYYFGRRYYNPSLHRWLTCDPKGYDGGPNLYAYCLNAPLSHIDLYGLVGIGGGFDPNWLSSLGKLFVNLARLPGLCLEFVGQNFVPIPLIRDVVEFSGHVLAGRGVTNYTPSYSRNHTEASVLMGVQEKNNATHHLVNGIGTSYKEFMQLVQDYQKAHGGVAVYYTYNGSKGIITDLIECGMQKLGIQTTSDKAFTNQINEVAKIYGPDHTFLVSAHSQGGMIVGNSLSRFDSNTRGHMHVRTMGSASIISDYSAGSVRNYVSKTDFIPLTDPWGYAKGLFGKANVTYMNPKSLMFPDHLINGKTYRDAADLIDNDFKAIIEGIKK